ncbi:MAG: hypothetical protein E4H27_07840, partial [Anaerolineales bacterium]
MKRLWTIGWSTLAAILMIAFMLIGLTLNKAQVSQPVLAALVATPVISGSDPASGPNDLDIAITITGDNFENGITGTLGSTSLQNLVWISTT